MNVFSHRISALQPSAIREILKFTADPTVISFAAGNPAPEAFPSETVAKLTADIFREEPVNALQYSVSEGYTPLREWLKADLGVKGVFNDRQDDIIITAGAQQVTEVMTKITCNEGDVIICEEPTFIGSLNAFRSYRADLVGVEADGEGINLEKLEKALKENPRTAFVYLIPNFQNPTGLTMSLERRKAVLELAYKYNVLILEDNPYGDVRFAGIDIPSLKELDRKRHVVYAGTFSKTLAPGLRVGFMCGAQNLVQKAVVCLQISTVHTPILSQMLAYRFVTQTDFGAHLERIQTLYKNKCKLMLDNLKYAMPMSIGFTEPEGGLFIWGTLPEDPERPGAMNYFCKKAVENKVAVVPGNAFLVDESKESLSFRLNYTSPTDEQIEKGVALLAETAKTMYR